MYRRILLPTDVFSADGPLAVPPVLKALETLPITPDTVLEACCVLSPATLGVSREELLEHAESYCALAASQLTTSVAGWTGRARLVAKALVELSSSREAAVEALLAHAEKEKFDLVALPTHARKGLDRFFIGSFTETLLMKSRIALLTVNPTAGESGGRRHLLVPIAVRPTDGATAARAVELARETAASVSLLHLVQPTAPLTLTTEYLGERALEHRIDEGRQRLERFRTGLASDGVPLSLEVDVALVSPGDSIAETARRLNASLIVQAPSPDRPVFPALGSTTRRVVRIAPCPVLTLVRPRGDNNRND